MLSTPTPPQPTRGRPHGAASNRPLTLLAHGALLLGATASVFLVVGPTQGSLGIFLLCAGAVMVFCPPRVQVSWGLWATAFGLVAGASLAFLPARWFPVPPWRAALAAVPGIALPGLVSPLPWETGFWLAVMAVSALAGLFALAHPMRTAGLVGFGCSAVGVCAVYAGLSIYAKQTGWHYPFAGTASFGFFPNRNHTATFLVVGSILAIGLLRIAWRDGRWVICVLAGAALALFVAALGFFSASRGGVVFLLVGTVIWAAGLGGRERNVPLLVSLAVLLLAGAGLFVVSGSEVRQRLLPAWNHTDRKARTGPDDIASDLRVYIYEDASRLVRDVPLTGVGLGAFGAVFPQYRQRSLNDSAALHPESDWLMLAAEAGVPTTLFAAVLLGGLLWQCRRWRTHPSWPLRWAFVAAVTAACLHGIVDVPLHRVALGWWVLALAGMALHGGWSEGRARSPVQHVLFVAGGLAALLLGGALVRAQWFGAPPLPPFRAVRAEEEILAQFNRHEYGEALEHAQQAVSASPLAAPLYFQLGVLWLQFAETDAEADRAFQAQRAINPNWSSIPFEEGDVWLPIDSRRCASLWLEALQRQRRIDQSPTGSHGDTVGYFRNLLGRARSFPDVQRELAAGIAGQPAYLLAFIEETNPEVAAAHLSAVAAGNSAVLEAFSPTQREKILLLWYQKGNREDLLGYLRAHPDWEGSAWPLHLRQLVDGNQFEQAVRTAAERYQVSLDLPETSEARRPGLPAAAPVGEPAAEFTYFWQQRNPISARRVLTEALQTPSAQVNPEVLRLKAALSAHDADWAGAWQTLDHYLRQTRPGEYGF